MDTWLIFHDISFVSMEGRSVVSSATYWIVVGAVRVRRRQIRVSALMQPQAEPEDKSSDLSKMKARFQEKLLRYTKRFRTANRHR